MNAQQQQRLPQQLETLVEQSHRLQLELLGLMRSVMETEPPAPVTELPEVRVAQVQVDLPDKPMFSVEEAARILGIGRTTAYQCARSGQIPALRLENRLLIPRAALARMLGG